MSTSKEPALNSCWWSKILDCWIGQQDLGSIRACSVLSICLSIRRTFECEMYSPPEIRVMGLVVRARNGVGKAAGEDHAVFTRAKVVVGDSAPCVIDGKFRELRKYVDADFIRTKRPIGNVVIFPGMLRSRTRQQ